MPLKQGPVHTSTAALLGTAPYSRSLLCFFPDFFFFFFGLSATFSPCLSADALSVDCRSSPVLAFALPATTNSADSPAAVGLTAFFDGSFLGSPSCFRFLLPARPRNRSRVDDGPVLAGLSASSGASPLSKPFGRWKCLSGWRFVDLAEGNLRVVCRVSAAFSKCCKPSLCRAPDPRGRLDRTWRTEVCLGAPTRTSKPATSRT